MAPLQIHLAARGAPTLRLTVRSVEMASGVFARYRDTYDLVVSDLNRGCGNISDENGTLVARVSYNGRIWAANGALLREPTEDTTTGSEAS